VGQEIEVWPGIVSNARAIVSNACVPRVSELVPRDNEYRGNSREAGS